MSGDLRRARRVLDIGSGARPHPAATVLGDLALETTWHGRRRRIPTGGRPFVRCSVERLPFRDGAFDFVVCRHVLEHVRDPAAACLELMRVARQGYIECPRSWVEYAFSSEDHRWLVDHEARVLIFREKLPEERRDFLGIQYAIFDWLRQPAFLQRWNEPGILRVRNVMVSWSGQFAFAVMMADERRGRGRSRKGAARRR